MNYIEQLLAKIEDAEARQQFSGLADKYSVINDFIVDPDTREKVSNIEAWAETNWDTDHGMSRLEYRQQQELQDMKTQLESKKDGMELNELNEHLGKFMKENGLMTRAEFDAGVKAKEEAFNQELNVISRLATRVPYLNARYQKEFGEMFDPDEFVKQANEKGYASQGVDGLDTFYGEFTREKAEAKRQADVASQVAAAKLEGRNEALRERLAAGGTGPGMPTLDGSPEMGHFEAKLRGLASKPIDPNAAQVPAEVELGRGVGRYAAAMADARDLAGRVN